MKFPFSIIITFFFTMCGNTGSQNGPATIEGIIENADKNWIYLEEFLQNKPKTLDSAKIQEDGSFQIPNKTQKMDFYRLSLGGKKAFLLITDSTENITLDLDATHLRSANNVKGSEHTALLNDFYKKAGTHRNELDSLIKLIKHDGANASKQTRKIFQQKRQAYMKFLLGFVTDHTSSPACLPVLSELNPIQNTEHFEMAADSLETVIPHSAYYKHLETQIQKAKQQKAKRKKQQQQQAQRQQMLGIGKKAPNITMENPEGEEKSLKDLRGKYVLIDFWASWCKPCRIENPNVVKVYEKYKDQGFEIFGVSLDKKKGAWKKAIKQDGLPWIQVSDLQGWKNAAAQKYGVRSIPYTVLLDKEGKIIAKKLRGKALENKLDQIFNK